ncbi:MAG: GNAT family N-acetyltransferase [Rhodobacter sp.]|nr:GNAT family N-acetyltransferase [Rhodobacter sp.]
MTLPTGPDLFGVLDATWPSARTRRIGPWTIRDGQGGGKRTSATTAEAAVLPDSIARAEMEMSALGQPHLFMLRPGEEALDAELAARGYDVIDPVVLYAAPLGQLTDVKPPPVATFTIWPPLAIMADLWAAGGIGPARLAVMQRAIAPKTAILARQADQPAGAGFVAIHDGIAMIHAIEVAPAHRRSGVGTNILRAAAHWAQAQGASYLALAVTRANTGANALYSNLTMQVVGHYHYRIK